MNQQNNTNNTQVRKVFRPTKTKMIEAIKKNAGIIANIAMALGWRLSRDKVYRYIKKYHLENELENARQLLVDKAESNIVQAVSDGDLETSKFVLKTRGKDRGYTERAEIEHSGDMEEHLYIYLPPVENK